MTIEQLILKYEMDFFRKEFCDNIQNLKNRIHDEFIEFGKSGQVFDNNSIIKYLNHLDSDRDIEIQHFEIKDLKDDLIVANYVSNEIEEGIKALRTSIWVKEYTNWKLYFHQGTVTESDTFK
ncbi:MAG: DUF4440 domain-containing protein [Clostridiaceae bacterium]|nr:DUF4440 domain-containing protein [Clostridiaceae bacterium]MBW4858496.1 DUF4440 domain-containing protein [Clostridiaceae bacterium]MBW4868783.1 DUF4440 domain-containing protein [Clostridiaceae bacterium]